MPIHIGYGDKNGVLSQRLDSPPIAATDSDALFAGGLCGNRGRVWGVMWIDTEMLDSDLDVTKDV